MKTFIPPPHNMYISGDHTVPSRSNAIRRGTLLKLMTSTHIISTKSLVTNKLSHPWHPGAQKTIPHKNENCNFAITTVRTLYTRRNFHTNNVEDGSYNFNMNFRHEVKPFCCCKFHCYCVFFLFLAHLLLSFSSLLFFTFHCYSSTCTWNRLIDIILKLFF